MPDSRHPHGPSARRPFPGRVYRGDLAGAGRRGQDRYPGHHAGDHQRRGGLDPRAPRAVAVAAPQVAGMKPLWRTALIAVALAWPMLAPGPTGATDLPAGYWPLAKSQPLIDKTRRVRLAPDLSRLGPGETAALAKLIEVGRIFQTLYERQLHPQAERASAALRDLDQKLGGPPETRNLLTLYRKFEGPIAELLDDSREAFLPVDPVQPGKNVYPWGIDKAE